MIARRTSHGGWAGRRQSSGISRVRRSRASRSRRTSKKRISGELSTRIERARTIEPAKDHKSFAGIHLSPVISRWRPDRAAGAVHPVDAALEKSKKIEK